MDTSAMDDEDDDEDEVFNYDEDQVGDSVLSSVGLLGGENQRSLLVPLNSFKYYLMFSTFLCID